VSATDRKTPILTKRAPVTDRQAACSLDKNQLKPGVCRCTAQLLNNGAAVDKMETEFAVVGE